ncbi:MAG: RdgB/HAM1 family non-canonical purine NTP pyrophosphatase [Anaerolineales bacterium]|nr:RdgB/HAM1 family non-canonical purine NTP pyrophosphatase [Anaerolineales bacterium]
MIDRLLVATNNVGKVREYGRLLAAILPQTRLLSLAQAGIDYDVDETGETFAANAQLKAEAYGRLSDLPVLADDSGLTVAALGGWPGVHSKRWAGEETTAAERNAFLLAKLAAVPAGQRQAQFVCVISFRLPDGRQVQAEGRLAGEIGFEIRGTHGFGYDPLFVLPEGVTLAELTADEKNAISHRGRAARAIAPQIAALLAE